MGSNQLALFPECFSPLSFDQFPPLAKSLVAYFDSFKSGIYTGEKYLARRFGVCVRTIQRTIVFLREAGWLRWKRRGKKGLRTNLYTLCLQQVSHQNVASEMRVPIREEKQRTPNWRAWFGFATKKTMEPLQDKAFDSYKEAYYGVGMVLNPEAWTAAEAQWRRMSIEDRIGALRDALTTFPRTKTAMIPLPVNHLRNKRWTYVFVERQTPYRPNGVDEPVKTESIYRPRDEFSGGSVTDPRNFVRVQVR